MDPLGRGKFLPQMPFYLCDPSRTRFTPTSHQPVTLSAQLNGIREELLDELDDDDIPDDKKKHSTLDYFLGGKYDIEEMVQEMQLAQQTLGKSNNDDCTLLGNLRKMQTSHLSKRLEPLDQSQMKAFRLLEQPEELSIFPPELKDEVDERLKKRLDKEEKRKKRKAKRKENVTPTGSSQDSWVPSPKAVKLQERQVVPVDKSTLTPILSGMVVNSQPNSLSSLASKKSVAAALKGVRRFRGRGRGRGGLARSFRGRSRGKVTSGIGRGRPRKAENVEEILQPRIILKIKPLPPRPVEPEPEPTPSPLTPIPSPSPPQQEEEEISIKRFEGLKMTMKLGRKISEMSGRAVPSPFGSPRQGSKTTNVTEGQTSTKRESLICRIRLPKSKTLEAQQKPNENKDEEDDEDDSTLDLY